MIGKLINKKRKERKKYLLDHVDPIVSVPVGCWDCVASGEFLTMQSSPTGPSLSLDETRT